MFGQGAKGKQPDRHRKGSREFVHVCKGRDGIEGELFRDKSSVLWDVFSFFSLFLFSLYFK